MAVNLGGGPWNKGKLVGQKAAFKLKEIWAIRVRLQLGKRDRELALFNLGIDSKLRACDLIKLRVRDVSHGTAIAARAIVMQQKMQRPVQFEITDQAKDALFTWIRTAKLQPTITVSQSYRNRVGASIDAAVCTHRTFLGRRDWPRPGNVCNAFDAPDKGLRDLSSHKELTRRTAVARPYQAREHSSISWRRS